MGHESVMKVQTQKVLRLRPSPFTHLSRKELVKLCESSVSTANATKKWCHFGNIPCLTMMCNENCSDPWRWKNVQKGRSRKWRQEENKCTKVCLHEYCGYRAGSLRSRHAHQHNNDANDVAEAPNLSTKEDTRYAINHEARMGTLPIFVQTSLGRLPESIPGRSNTCHGIKSLACGATDKYTFLSVQKQRAPEDYNSSIDLSETLRKHPPVGHSIKIWEEWLNWTFWYPIFTHSCDSPIRMKDQKLTAKSHCSYVSLAEEDHNPQSSKQRFETQRNW